MDVIALSSENSERISDGNVEIKKSLRNKIEDSLVIKKFPRRLIKKGTSSQTGTQFEMTFSCQYLNPKITIDVTDVKSYIVNGMPDGTLQRIEINSKFETCGHQLWIVKNMRVRASDSRRSSKNTISEKSVVLFVVTLSIKAKGLTMAWTKDLYSDTVVIIVHSNQEIDAQLTLFIDDYFRPDPTSFIEGRGFPIKPTTEADELCNCFSDYFFKETGRGLTFDNRKYLFDKIKCIYQTYEIPINDIIKKMIPQSKLTFGQWIVSLIRLCKNDHINKLWSNEFIEGFVPKDVGHMLQAQGSFLLRFAERQAAIGVVLRSETNEIDPWDPFTESECRKIKLANHLCDFSSLKTLRKADGTFVLKSAALTNFMDKKSVGNGYTSRGSINPLQNYEEENYSTGTSLRDETENGAERSLSTQLSREEDNYSNRTSLRDENQDNVADDNCIAEDEMDIDEIDNICTNLLTMDAIN